ncbi:MAG: hypothetical protein ACFB50_10040 [Rubrobacteraceae bacterium]
MTLAAVLAGLVLSGCGNTGLPEGTLSYRGEFVVGKSRTHCPPAFSARCAGMVFAFDNKLAVPAGSELIFSYGGEDRPRSVELVAYPLAGKSPAGELSGNSVSLLAGGREEWKMVELPSQRMGTFVPVTAPPGHYIVESSLGFSDREVDYHFYVVVERPA